MEVLEQIFEKRKRAGIGHNSTRFLELFGAELVPIVAHEPDPNTFRSEYYYNSRINQLFRKLSTLDERIAWKRIGG